MKRWGPYMMKQPMVWLLAALALSPLVAAESLYVHSAKASLLAAPKFNADILVSVEKGAELVLIEQQKRWFLVQFDDQTGWVSSLLVKSEPPLDKVSVIGSDAVEITGQTRSRASEVSTAGATRGLTESDASTDDGVSDYNELVEMEGISVPGEEIIEFADAIVRENGE